MRRKGLVGGQIMLIIYIVIFIICIALAYIILDRVAGPVVDTLKRQWGWIGTLIVGVGTLLGWARGVINLLTGG